MSEWHRVLYGVMAATYVGAGVYATVIVAQQSIPIGITTACAFGVCALNCASAAINGWWPR